MWKSEYGLVVECNLPKVETGVRFPLLAHRMSSKFKRQIEDFTCEYCGEEVVGSGFTNHCPKCLWSKHVDINPGDRAENCAGLMKPIGMELEKGKYVITQKCLKCSRIWRNQALAGDDISQFLINLLQ